MFGSAVAEYLLISLPGFIRYFHSNDPSIPIRSILENTHIVTHTKKFPKNDRMNMFKKQQFLVNITDTITMITNGNDKHSNKCCHSNSCHRAC